METKSVLDKYKKLIAGLLDGKEKDVKFWNEVLINLSTPQVRYEWAEIGELYYIKPDWEDEEHRDLQHQAQWLLGKYRVTYRGEEVSTWKLYQMPHCCGIMVSCNVNITENFRHKRIGTTLNILRQDIGRLLGYSCILCTDIEQNKYQRRILATNGWKDIHNVVNKRTQNRIYISVINL